MAAKELDENTTWYTNGIAVYDESETMIFGDSAEDVEGNGGLWNHQAYKWFEDETKATYTALSNGEKVKVEWVDYIPHLDETHRTAYNNLEQTFMTVNITTERVDGDVISTKEVNVYVLGDVGIFACMLYDDLH